jgi:hypothetical protein
MPVRDYESGGRRFARNKTKQDDECSRFCRSPTIRATPKPPPAMMNISHEDGFSRHGRPDRALESLRPLGIYTR